MESLDTSVTQHLIDLEKEYLVKNRSITEKSKQILQETSRQVTASLGLLNEPVLISRAAEPTEKIERPTSKKTRKIEKEPVTDEQGLGLDATNRLLKAKLSMLTQDFDKLETCLKNKQTEITNLEQKLGLVSTSLQKATKTSSSQQSKLALLTRSNEELLEKNINLIDQLTAIKRDNIQPISKPSEDTHKINRLNEQLSIQKQAAAKLEAGFVSRQDVLKKQNSTLVLEKSKLEKQKIEMSNIIKKQCMLINVLQRQKTHVEAMCLLGLTEKEFLKVLDRK